MNEGGKFEMHVYQALGQPLLAPAAYIKVMINLYPFNLPEDKDHDKPCPQPGAVDESLLSDIFLPMKLADLNRIERNKELKLQKEQYALGKKLRQKKIDPELPGVRSSGLVETMTPEEKTALFEKMRKESGLL